MVTVKMIILTEKALREDDGIVLKPNQRIVYMEPIVVRPDENPPRTNYKIVIESR